MLRATRRVLRPGGRLAFWVIHPAAGLSAARRRLAVELGPRAVSTKGRTYAEMLAASGFTSIGVTDLTAEFRATTFELRQAWQSRERELIATLGRGVVEDRMASQLKILTAVKEGLLRRSLLLALAP